MLVRFLNSEGQIYWVNSLNVTRLTQHYIDERTHIHFDNTNYCVVQGNVDEVAAQLNAALTAPVATTGE